MPTGGHGRTDSGLTPEERKVFARGPVVASVSYSPRPYRLSPRIRFWVRVVLYTLLGLLVSKADPFGLGDGAGLYSSGVVKAVLAPFHRTAGEDAITVVLVDDETLTRTHRSWPLSYDTHGRVLAQILALRPKAVFVDILFGDRREGDPTLNTMVGLIQARAGPVEQRAGGDFRQRIPVFWAAGRAAAADPRRNLTILPELARVGRPVVTSWSGVRGYPLRHARPDAESEPSAALALYKEVCARVAPAAGGVDRAFHCPGQWVDQDFDRPMSVMLGVTVPREQWNWTRRPSQDTWRACKQVDDGLWDRLWYGAGLVGQMLLRGFFDEDDVAQRCLPHLTVPAWYLIDGDASQDQAVQEGLRRVIEDRVVIYGLHLEGINDVAPSPAHGLVPGAHVHAMALDNLMKYGTSYVRLSGGGEGGFAMGSFVQGLVWFVLVVITCAWMRRLETPRQGVFTIQSEDVAITAIRDVDEPWYLSGFVIVTLEFGIVFAVGAVLFCVFNIAPLNWIGLVGLITVAWQMIEAEPLLGFFRMFRRFLNRLRADRTAADPPPQGQQE